LFSDLFFLCSLICFFVFVFLLILDLLIDKVDG
jgi:hypothetical protein